MKRPVALRRLESAIGNSPGAQSEAYGNLVRPLLPKLERFVKQEFSYLRDRGDLTADYPTAQDVIDEVLARAYQKLDQLPRQTEPLHWLYRIAHEVLAEVVKRRQAEDERFVSLDAKPPETPDETIDERDEARYEYWQPDDMLKLEDVVPISDATPETTASEDEMRRHLRAALAHLPSTWRRAVWLTQAEGMPLGAVAATLGASEEDTRRWIQHADAFLRARLGEVDLRPVEPGQIPAYFAPLPAASTPELAQVFDQITGNGK